MKKLIDKAVQMYKEGLIEGIILEKNHVSFIVSFGMSKKFFKDDVNEAFEFLEGLQL